MWSVLAAAALLGGVLGQFVRLRLSDGEITQIIQLNFSHIALAALALLVGGRMLWTITDAVQWRRDITHVFPQAVPWLILLLWAALSVTWSEQGARAFGAAVLLALEVLLGVVVAVLAYRGHAGRLCAVVAIAALPHALLALAQFAQGDTLGLTMLGEKPWNPADPHGFGPEPFRAHGLAVHPNGLSGYLSVAIMLGVVWLSTHTTRRGRLAVAGVLIVLFLGLLATASRTAVLANTGFVLLAAGITWAISRVITRPWRGLLWLGLGGVIFLGVWLSPIAAPFRERLPVASEWWYLQNRLTVGFPKTLTVWAQQPALGTGIDGLRPALNTLPPDPDFSLGVLVAHNVYIVVLAEFGVIVAVILFAAALIFPLRRLFTARPLRSVLSLLALLTVCGMMMWDYYFWHGYPLRMLVLWLSGLAWGLTAQSCYRRTSGTFKCTVVP